MPVQSLSYSHAPSYEIQLDLKQQQWLAQNADVVLDAVVDAIVTIDDRGTIRSINKATLKTFGYLEEELVGEPVIKLMPQPYKAEHQGYVDQYQASRVPKIIGIGRELSAVKKDGTVFPIYLAVSEIHSAEGVYFVGIIRDLSEQKAAEDALLEQREQAAQAGRVSTMGEMTASIAHEINQPLTAISMYAQAVLRLMNKPNVDHAKVLEALEKLNDQSIRAGAVIERIQRFMSHADGEKEFVDLNELVGDITHLAAGDARLHGIDLVLDLDQSIKNVFCDPIQIQQVVLNLVRNAIDAMYEIGCKNGRVVKLTTQNVSNDVALEVVDCGSGIKDEVAKTLFTPFNSTKRNGMGMGLAICKNIVDEHGGTLQFENNDAHGATFKLSLPGSDE